MKFNKIATYTIKAMFYITIINLILINSKIRSKLRIKYHKKVIRHSNNTL